MHGTIYFVLPTIVLQIATNERAVRDTIVKRYALTYSVWLQKQSFCCTWNLFQYNPSYYSENRKFPAVHSLRNEGCVLSDTICCGTRRFLNFSQWRLRPRHFQDRRTEFYRRPVTSENDIHGPFTACFSNASQVPAVRELFLSSRA